MPQSSNHYEKLEEKFEDIEKHLRSLEGLGENIENKLMISLLQTKLPRHVLARLEEYKNNDDDWTVKNFRKEAHEIGSRLLAIENETSAENHGYYKQDHERYYVKWPWKAKKLLNLWRKWQTS